MKIAKRYWFVDIVLIFLIIGGFYSIQLGSRPLSNPDESRYSSVANNMLISGNFVTPKVASVIFLDKPPMYYWLQAVAIKSFGINAWAIRFFPMLIGLLGCLLTYISTRLLFSRRTGILASVILATSFLYYGCAHYADMNIEVAVFISSSLLFFLLGYRYRERSHHSYLFWFAYIFAGIAFLTKGLIGIVFPTMIIGLWILLGNRWYLLKKVRLFSGLLLFLAIIAPWIILVQQQNSNFLHYFFIYQQFDRFLHTGFNNNQPFWFYFTILFIGFGGWTTLIFPSTRLLYQKLKVKHPTAKYLNFFIIWILSILIFFSIPKAKLVGYIAPTLIPLAILIANYVEQHWNKVANIAIKIAAIFSLIYLACFPLALDYTIKKGLWHGGKHSIFIVLTIVTITALILLISFLQKAKFKFYFIYITICSSLFTLLLNNSLIFIPLKSTKPLINSLTIPLNEQAVIVNYRQFNPDLNLYLQSPTYIAANWQNLAHSTADTDINFFAHSCYQKMDVCPALISLVKLRQWWQMNKVVYVVTDSSKLTKFRQDIGPYHILAKTKQYAFISNL